MLTKSVNIKLGTENLSGLTATTTWGYFKLKEKKKETNMHPNLSTPPGTKDCNDATLERGELGTKIPKYCTKQQ